MLGPGSSISGRLAAGAPRLLALFGAALLLLVVARAVRAAARDAAARDYGQPAKRRAPFRRGLEIAWAVIPLALLMAFFCIGWKTTP